METCPPAVQSIASGEDSSFSSWETGVLLGPNRGWSVSNSLLIQRERTAVRIESKSLACKQAKPMVFSKAATNPGGKLEKARRQFPTCSCSCAREAFRSTCGSRNSARTRKFHKSTKEMTAAVYWTQSRRPARNMAINQRVAKTMKEFGCSTSAICRNSTC
jgi:hypothetical protein